MHRIYISHKSTHLEVWGVVDKRIVGVQRVEVEEVKVIVHLVKDMNLLGLKNKLHLHFRALLYSRRWGKIERIKKGKNEVWAICHVMMYKEQCMIPLLTWWESTTSPFEAKNLIAE